MLQQYMEELQKIQLLDRETEMFLWRDFKDAGNRDSRTRLIEQYQPLVFREVMRWHIPSNLEMDAVQEGTVGLIEAVDRFDYARGVAFSLFGCHRIRGRVIDYLQKEQRIGAVSIDEPLGESGLLLQDILSDNAIDLAEQTDQTILFEQVTQAMGKLPPKEKLVVQSVYLRDEQQKHIADELSLSLTYVYRLRKKGIQRIRGMLSRLMGERNRE